MTTAAGIPYVDIAGQHAAIKEELLAAVARVIDHGRFILGEEVAEFERRFAELCGVRFVIGLNSGTDALILALRALEIGPGDEVITAPNSFVASTSCIRLVGATPVFVDVDDSYNIDPSKIAPAITPRTRAILPVHLTGRPCEMDPIMEIARARGLAVVEDCAQAVLAEYGGRRVGAIGTAGAFSLHPLKTLNACGDGGVLTTNDERIAEHVRLTRNLGLKTRDNCVLWSSNSRLDTIQAAMLLVKLRYVEGWTARRRALAARYRAGLAGVPGVRVPLDETARMSAVYHTFVIQADRRDALRRHLEERHVGSNVHYPVPIHLSDAGLELGYPRGSFPEAETQADRILSLPIHPELTESDIDDVCTHIRAFSQGA